MGDRVGQGTTGTIRSVWQQTEDLEVQRVEMAIAQGRVVVELEQVVGVAEESKGSLKARAWNVRLASEVMALLHQQSSS